MHPATPSPRARFILALTTFLLLCLDGTAWASYDNLDARVTLKGIKVLRVNVERLPSDLEKLGLTKDQIQVDVELRLRQSGITVAHAEALAIPYLRVSLNSHHETDSNVLGFSITVEFFQFVRLSRDMSIEVPAPTWAMAAVGTGSARPLQTSQTALRDHVRDVVDRFINAYLEQNPKR